MFKQDTIEVQRDCEATLIPSGASVILQKGSLVYITQALGNSYTIYVNGNLARVAGKDGDALNRIIMEDVNPSELVGTVQEKVWELLRTCFDPEIPVNVVDLGLVYECNISSVEKGECVSIKMTLTAPGCGMGPVLVADVEQKVRALPEVVDVKVDLVFDPPWERSMMSDVAKLQLGML